MRQTKFNTRLEDKIDKVRGALYACSKANCNQCPVNGHGRHGEFCMTFLLKQFNALIDEIRGQQ